MMPDFISRPTRESVLMISLPVVAWCYGDHKGASPVVAMEAETVLAMG